MTPPSSPAAAVLADLAHEGDELERLREVYVDLHRHPELSHHEVRTAGLLADALRSDGYDVQTGVGGTGVVATLTNGAGPVVALRADMDALPVREDTGLPYASDATAPGPDGTQVPVMHACGHDMHVTWLLGAARALARGHDRWAGTVVLLGQPAEERGSGAEVMVADRLAERMPRPDVVLGQHLAPAPAGWVLHREGPAMAGSDMLRVVLHGRGGHGSRPETTVDPVVLAAATVLRLQTVVAREVAAAETAVVTVGALHAGGAGNVIAATAELTVNVRTYDAGVRARVLAAIERIVRGEALASGAPRDPEVVSLEAVPMLVNHPAATARTRAAHTAALGAERVLDMPVVMGSEDFGVLGEGLGAPSVFWLTGGSDAEHVLRAMAEGRYESDVPSNHSPRFAPVLHPTLIAGVEALVVGALGWLDS